MSWFSRKEKGIVTPTANKKETPDGLWYKCPECKNMMPSREHRNYLFTCSSCNYHERIGSEAYFQILFDQSEYQELNENLVSADPLEFHDSKPYAKRIRQTQEKTHLKDAIRTAYGTMEEMPLVIACMDFAFIGGSMGSVMGEKIARAVDYAIEQKCPFLLISRSGGARMMEGGLSLMQMAKTSAKLLKLSEAKLPYVSLMTDPTTGGVSASCAMLGDMNVAEPQALIGFAGPRVIRETIGKDLPKGFQTSEYLLEHGFLDFIVDRKELKTKLSRVYRMLK